MCTSGQTMERQCGGFNSGTIGAPNQGCRQWAPSSGHLPGNSMLLNTCAGALMQPAYLDGMPNDVLIVEDDPIIALDLEDTILGFAAKTVAPPASVARALALIAEQVPAFALLDV